MLCRTKYIILLLYLCCITVAWCLPTLLITLIDQTTTSKPAEKLVKLKREILAESEMAKQDPKLMGLQIQEG